MLNKLIRGAPVDARSADGGDLMRRLRATSLQLLVDAEATAFIGAEPHERTDARTNQRDGRWDDVMWTRDYDKWGAYGQAKTVNALFARHLDAVGAQQGVRAFSVNPGGILTPLQRHLTRAEMVDMGWVAEAGNELAAGFKTVQQGAATTIWAVTSPLLDGLGGVYCEDCDVAEDSAGRFRVGVAAWAADPEQAARLWSLSLKLSGIPRNTVYQGNLCTCLRATPAAVRTRLSAIEQDDIEICAVAPRSSAAHVYG